MPGQPLRLGPFVGGLNTQADPTAIADVELQECVNFELDLDNALVSRPPIKTTTNMSSTWTERILMLGYGIIGSTVYLFGGNTNGTFVYSGGVWTQLSSTFRAVACIQYNNRMYFLNEPGGAGISRTLADWDGTTFTILNPANLNTMLPGFGGGALAIYKERLFIVPGINATANTTRLVFSDAGAPQTYTATTQFIDINSGDGQKLVDLQVYADNLMLFKEDSTYALTYTSRPADAEVVPINTNIGVSSKKCVIPYENSLFVLHRGKVYEMNGSYNYSQINTRVPFEYDSTTPSARSENFFLSLLGTRLIARYYNKVYVYGLKTRTWSNWESSSTDLHNFGPVIPRPMDISQVTFNEYYAGSCVQSNENFFIIKDGYGVTDRENASGTDYSISCYIKTKNYDLSTPHTYKKLNWWGADVNTSNSVTGLATPYAYGFLVSWGTLNSNNKMWSDLLTWNSPINNSLVSTSVTSTSTGLDRVFAKFAKALRFRTINFTVTLSTNGYTTDGPVKLFSLTAFVNNKQVVSKSLS